MPEMTNEEALGHLQRMEAEQRALDALKVSWQHVAGVIQAYQRALAALPDLTSQRQQHEQSLIQLQQDYRNQETTAKKRLAEVKADCENRMAAARQEADAAETEAKRIEAECQTRVEQARRRALEAEHRATDREEQLSALTKALSLLKQQHGLA